jgi:proteasome beta subunit
MTAEEALLCCVQALYDAADDDSATGGPVVPRRIYPVAATVTAEGFRRLPEADNRMSSPDGPHARLRG